MDSCRCAHVGGDMEKLEILAVVWMAFDIGVLVGFFLV
jgi:hypothetical protein